MLQTIKHHLIVSEDYAGWRIDQTLADLLPQYSRSRLKEWIDKGAITLNNRPCRPKHKLTGGEEIHICATFEQAAQTLPEDIPLSIIYEDNDILIINKPHGMVVHPATGHHSNTLVNALLYHDPKLAILPRAGVIHRLDKDTSGLLVIAKNPKTHTYLIKQLQQHKITREYEAIISGVLTGGGTINAPIGRHHKKRTHMAIRDIGKPAITHYRIIQKFRAHTHVKVILETGRTHQIRVHMASIHHSIIGDQTYGERLRIPKNASEQLISTLRCFKRQALHAKRLELTHPETRELISWSAILPFDMQNLLSSLNKDLET